MGKTKHFDVCLGVGGILAVVLDVVMKGVNNPTTG